MMGPAGLPRKASSRFLRWNQDTIVALDMVDTFEKVVRSYSSSARLAVIGSNYRDKVNGKLLFDPTASDEFAGSKIVSVLTSGSLISIDAFETTVGFETTFSSIASIMNTACTLGHAFFKS
jgi:hypothetical protein